MSTLKRDMGIILRHIPHGEASGILTVFMREHGRVGLMAKGIRAKKKIGSNVALEPFTRAQFVYYFKPTRDLQLAKEWTVESPHLGARSNLRTLTVAAAVIELLMRCTREDDPHPVLFDSAEDTLSALDARTGGELALLWKFEIGLFEELGFRLQFDTCAVTARPLKPPFAGPIRYRFADGAFLLPHAVTHEAGDGSLGPEAFAVLASLRGASRQFVSRISVPARTEHEITAFLARYLEAHLPVSGTLKSLAALHW
jgi:DNA repair protein RecO (recombination protein O)